MKKYHLMLLMFVQIFSGHISGQNCIKSIFDVEVRETEYGSRYVDYTNKNWDNYQSSPIFTSNERSARDLVNFHFISTTKKDSIEQVLFTKEELDSLNRGIAICKIHIPSGKIVSVSFSIPIQNKVENGKMIRYKNAIEKNLFFNVTLYSDLKKEGYLIQSFPIFTSSRKQ